jgi:hypothetical protein
MTTKRETTSGATSDPVYESTQSTSGRWWMPFMGIIALAAGWPLLLERTPSTVVPMVSVIALSGLVFSSFTALRVTVTDDTVTVAFRFGWPRRRLDLGRVTSYRRTRYSAIHGWGIRAIRGGWLWRASGRDAVEMEVRDGRKLGIGCADPDALIAALDAALARREGRHPHH